MATDTMTADEDRLPWLEAVEDEDDRGGPSAAKLIGALLIGLAAIAAVIFAIFQMGNRDGRQNSDVELIAADDGAFKEPAVAGSGMKVEGEGDTAFAASEGADPNGKINLDAIPEQPVAGARGIAPAQQMKVKADARKAQDVPNASAPPAAAKPVVVPTPTPRFEPAKTPVVTPSGGSTVQLGAFSSNNAAQGAWKSLSSRISALKPLTSSVVSASVGGKTVYRLRTSVPSPAEAKTLCGKLKIAGESCSIIG